MKNTRVFRFLKNLGLISRLMIAVGVAIVAGGGVQTVLLVAEGAAEHSARLLREQKETLQFVKQLQIVAVTLFLMLQFIWLIFRGNLGTLRMLAEGANRFSQGDHAVRIEPEGAPEVGLAAEAFNNMANNIEGLIASLGKSESKNKLLATIVEQSSEAIWTKDLAGIITSWNSGAAAMFGYPPADAVGRALNVGESTP